MDDIPSHRAGMTARSGDTHVIGSDGAAVNVDRAARETSAPVPEIIGGPDAMAGDPAAGEQLSVGDPPAEPIRSLRRGRESN